LLLGIYRDAWERRQLEARVLQSQKLHAVGLLAAGVAHEFNNLLTGLGGYATLGLREPGVAEPVRDFFRKIAALAQRAARLTRQLLSATRRPAVSREPVVLEDHVRSAAEVLAVLLGNDVTLTVDLPAPGGPPLLALADANQLQQAFLNLVLNARDALTAPGPIVCRLRHVVYDQEQPAFPGNIPAGDYAVIEVQDRGSGMTREVLDRALDPFFTTKEPGRGTGLGLPMVLGVAHSHHGHLRIDSEPGRGTCVGLYLPRWTGPADGPAASEDATGLVAEREHLWGRHCLVTHDPQEVLGLVRYCLDRHGPRVTCAVSSSEELRLPGPDGGPRLRQDEPAAPGGQHFSAPRALPDSSAPPAGPEPSDG
jgi:signal transduction histidine kinase